MLGHAELARLIRTPVCLDESIVSAAIRGRRDRARRLLDRQHQAGPGRRLPRGPARSTTCARPHGVPVWCGGMLETGLGRAANVALAALPGFTLPGDTSGSRPRTTAATSPSRSCSTDGHLAVPTGPGLGVRAAARGARDRQHARSRSCVTSAAAARSCPGRPRPRSSIPVPSARRQRHAFDPRAVARQGRSLATPRCPRASPRPHRLPSP